MPAPNPDRSFTSDEIESAAADWLARRDAGWLPAERRQFELWLRQDPRHASAWAALDSAWAAFDRPRSVGAAGAMIQELAVRQRTRRRRWLGGSAVSAALAAAVVFMALPKAPPSFPGGGEAVLSKVDRRVLADGTVVELDQGAAIEVDYLPATRQVHLVRGQAHFAVAKNPSRPFVVSAGRVQVWAVGTAFAVKLGSEAVDVLVTEGKVAVDRPPAVGMSPAPSAPASRAILVPAGERLVVPMVEAPAERLQPQALEPVEMIERRLAWRGPRLELSGTPLARAVAVFNRENSVRLSIADPALGDMRMSGLFRADNAEGFVRLLEASYGVKAERRDGAIILRKEP